MIYLDNAASTKMSERVIAAMKAYVDKGYFGNPDSRHCVGLTASSMVEGAREIVAKSIGAEPRQIIFTSGGTEANNLAIRGCGARYGVCSEGEHDSVYETILRYKNSRVIGLTTNGNINYDSLAAEMKRCAGFDPVLAFSAVNNEVGALNRLDVIEELKPADAWLHIDYVQAFGQFPINVKEHAIDSMSISSHKVHGPQGVGALYVRKPEKLSPILYGAKEQEFGLRPGTKNVLGIVGFGEACADVLTGAAATRLEIRDIFVKTLLAEMEKAFGSDAYAIMSINGWSNPKIVSLTFHGIDAETLIMMLSANGVCVSAGSACHAHTTKASRVLKAMRMSDEDAMCTIRVSFSSMTTVDEVMSAATKISETVKMMKG